MPKGYVIARVTVTNPEAYAEYAKGATEAIRQYGGRPLVRGGAYETLDGTWDPKRIVVIEFPSADQAKTWYHSPEYQAIAALRHQHAQTEFLTVVEGV